MKRLAVICLILLLLVPMMAALADSQLTPFEADGLWGYKKGKKIVIEPKFAKVESFYNNNVAVVQVYREERTRYGIINTAGEYVVSPVWDLILKGESGSQYCGEDGYYRVDDDICLSGVYDIKYNNFCEPKWKEIGFPNERDERNYLLVMDPDTSLYVYMDSSNGEMMIECMYIEARPFSEGHTVAPSGFDNFAR